MTVRDSPRQYDNLLDEDESFHRPVAAAPWLRFSAVEVRDERAIFGGDAGEATPGRRLLERFAALHGKPDDVIGAFALEWGPLALCRRHQRPILHPGCTSPPPFVGRMPRALAEDGEPPDAYSYPPPETLSAWRQYSAEAHDLLLAASALHRPAERGRSARDGEGEHAASWPDVTNRLDRWLQESRVALGLVPGPDGRPRIRFRTHGLHGVIGVLLLFAATKSKGVAFCNGCGAIFIPERLPRADQDTYCGEVACKRAALAAAQVRKRKGLAKPRRQRGETDEAFAARKEAWRLRANQRG